MIKDLKDARTAFGLGTTFLVYSLYLVWEYWNKQRKIHTETLARLIHDNASSRRAELINEEFGNANAEHRSSTD